MAEPEKKVDITLGIKKGDTSATEDIKKDLKDVQKEAENTQRELEAVNTVLREVYNPNKKVPLNEAYSGGTQPVSAEDRRNKTQVWGSEQPPKKDQMRNPARRAWDAAVGPDPRAIESSEQRILDARKKTAIASEDSYGIAEEMLAKQKAAIASVVTTAIPGTKFSKYAGLEAVDIPTSKEGIERGIKRSQQWFDWNQEVVMQTHEDTAGKIAEVMNPGYKGKWKPPTTAAEAKMYENPPEEWRKYSEGDVLEEPETGDEGLGNAESKMEEKGQGAATAAQMKSSEIKSALADILAKYNAEITEAEQGILNIKVPVPGQGYADYKLSPATGEIANLEAHPRESGVAPMSYKPFEEIARAMGVKKLTAMPLPGEHNVTGRGEHRSSLVAFLQMMGWGELDKKSKWIEKEINPEQMSAEDQKALLSSVMTKAIPKTEETPPETTGEQAGVLATGKAGSDAFKLLEPDFGGVTHARDLKQKGKNVNKATDIINTRIANALRKLRTSTRRSDQIDAMLEALPLMIEQDSKEQQTLADLAVSTEEMAAARGKDLGPGGRQTIAEAKQSTAGAQARYAARKAQLANMVPKVEKLKEGTVGVKRAQPGEWMVGNERPRVSRARARTEIVRQVLQSMGLPVPTEGKEPGTKLEPGELAEQKGAIKEFEGFNDKTFKGGAESYREGARQRLVNPPEYKGADVIYTGPQGPQRITRERIESELYKQMEREKLGRPMARVNPMEMLQNIYQQMQTEPRPLLPLLPPEEEEAPQKMGLRQRLMGRMGEYFKGVRNPPAERTPEETRFIREPIGYEMAKTPEGKTERRTIYGPRRPETEKEYAERTGTPAPTRLGLGSFVNALLGREGEEGNGKGGKGTGEAAEGANKSSGMFNRTLIFMAYRIMQVNRIIWQLATSTIQSLINAMNDWEGSMETAILGFGLQQATNPVTGQPFGGGPNAGGMTAEEKTNIIGAWPMASMEIQAAMGNITLAMMKIAEQAGPALVIIINAVAAALAGPIGVFLVSFINTLATMVPTVLSILQFLTPLMPALGWLAAMFAIIAPIIAVVAGLIFQLAYIIPMLIAIGGSVISIIGSVASIIGMTLLPVFSAIGTFITATVIPAVTGFLLAIGPLGWAIMAVIAAIILIIAYKDQLIAFFTDPVGAIQRAWGGLMDWINNTFGWMWGYKAPEPDTGGGSKYNPGMGTTQQQTVYQTNNNYISSDVDLDKVIDAMGKGSSDNMWNSSYGQE